MEQFRVALMAFFCFLFSVVAVSAHEHYCSQYESPEVRAIVDKVHDAVAHIETNGELAFDDFAVPGSRWLQGDDYVFVYAMDGHMMVNGGFPELNGRNHRDIRDISGKPVVRLMMEQINSKAESGWVHYLWPRPGSREPIWKSSFVHLATAPDGTRYSVAHGKYDIPMERCMAVDKVEEAAELIQREGLAAFPRLRDRTGPFLWKDFYVFVIDMDSGVEYVNPGQPHQEGRDVRYTVDADGKRFIAAMIDLARTDGEGWLNYKWPRPGHVSVHEKHSFVKRVRVGDRTFVVGSGIYVD